MQFWSLSVKTGRKLGGTTKSEGYEVCRPRTGAAITLIDQLDLDLALTDLMMGARMGWLCWHLRDASPQTLVILMTAHESIETSIEVIRLGAQDCIVKPLIFEMFCGKFSISSHTGSWPGKSDTEGKLSQHAHPDQPFGRVR
jgi:DNA-binding response OmpR family regulator